MKVQKSRLSGAAKRARGLYDPRTNAMAERLRRPFCQRRGDVDCSDWPAFGIEYGGGNSDLAKQPLLYGNGITVLPGLLNTLPKLLHVCCRLDGSWLKIGARQDTVYFVIRQVGHDGAAARR